MSLNIQFMQTAKVNSIIQNINWNIPHGLSIFAPKIVEDILKINLWFDNTTPNELIGNRSTNSDISFKDAYNCIIRDHVEPSWTKFILYPYIPLVKPLETWKFMQCYCNIRPSNSNENAYGFEMVSLQSWWGNCTPFISYMQVHLTFLVIDEDIFYHEHW